MWMRFPLAIFRPLLSTHAEPGVWDSLPSQQQTFFKKKKLGAPGPGFLWKPFGVESPAGVRPCSPATRAPCPAASTAQQTFDDTIYNLELAGGVVFFFLWGRSSSVHSDRVVPHTRPRLIL
jgi:hypothetical protein